MGERVDLDAIDARVNAATRGPWVWEPCRTECETRYQHVFAAPEALGDRVIAVANTWHSDAIDFGADAGTTNPRHGQSFDADFIAHARTDIPAMSAELRAARAEITELRAQVAGLAGEKATAISVLGYSIASAVLSGTQSPRQKRIYEAMHAPEVGQLVIEQSTIWDRSRDEARLGTLVRVEYEPIDATDWPEDEEIPEEKVWYLRLADGREYRWTNASFLAVPTRLDSLAGGDGFVSNPADFNLDTARGAATGEGGP